jgi:hypothetical protein
MKSPTLESSDGLLRDPTDFSLVLGGPLFQLLRRSHLSDDAMELVRLRVIVISLLAWLPLLVLSALEGQLLGGSAAVPFLLDVEVHIRFLVVVPLLIAAELVVHQRMRFVVRQFLERSLIPESALTRFNAAIASAFRLRNSVLAEVLLIAFVYVVGVLIIWRQYTALATATWYAAPTVEGSTLSFAGVWYGYVSLPIYQFLLMRWYFRIFIWMRFLWQVSRIDLSLVPTHPDRVGGLGFLANTVFAFTPLAVAHGAVVAGWIANRIFYLGPHCLTSRSRSQYSSSFYSAWCSARSWCLRRNLLMQSGRAIASMARWPSVTCASSMPSGCVAARLPMRRWWVAATSSPSPIWAIVSRWCGPCASRLLRRKPSSSSSPRHSRRLCRWHSP